MSVEQIPIVEEPNFNSLNQKTTLNTQETNDFVCEKIQETSAFCERHPVAIAAFLEKYLNQETV